MNAAVSPTGPGPTGVASGCASEAGSPRNTALALGVLFLSGAAALAQQILWTRRLVDLLGASTDTFSKVIGAFFVGLALGSVGSALRPASPDRAWRRLVVAELAVGILGTWVLLTVPVTDSLYALPGSGPYLRLALPLILITPPAFAMGWVLPAMISAVQGQRIAVWLYAVNTLGGVLGIAGMTFIALPRWGLTGAGIVACALNGSIALALLVWRPAGRLQAEHPVSAGEGGISLAEARVLAIASGFLVLGLEVVSQHQFAQVTINSHFSSAAVLAAVLLALTAAAAWVGIARIETRSLVRLSLGMSAVACLLEPILFLSVRPGLQIIPYEWTAPRYFAAVAGLAGATLVPMFLSAGVLFPLLLRERGNPVQAAQLLAINGLGGWLGAELTPAWILPHAGLWRTVIGAGAAYWLLHLFVGRRAPISRHWLRASLAIFTLGGLQGLFF